MIYFWRNRFFALFIDKVRPLRANASWINLLTFWNSSNVWKRVTLSSNFEVQNMTIFPIPNKYISLIHDTKNAYLELLWLEIFNQNIKRFYLFCSWENKKYHKVFRAPSKVLTLPWLATQNFTEHKRRFDLPRELKNSWKLNEHY